MWALYPLRIACAARLRHRYAAPKTGLRHVSNRSRACRNGNWKMASGDWRRKATGFRAESPEFASQRLGPARITAGMSAVLVGDPLSCGNLWRFPTVQTNAPQRLNWLAEDAVRCAPVSSSRFRHNREIYREFREFGLFQGDSWPQSVS
jgi:hypothetical protein